MIDKDEIRKIQKTVYTLIQDSEFEKSMGLIQTLLEQDPNDALALNFLGLSLIHI